MRGGACEGARRPKRWRGAVAVFWLSGRLAPDAPADLLEAIDIVRLGITLTYADLRILPQAVLDYLPMVSETLAQKRERETKRG